MTNLASNRAFPVESREPAKPRGSTRLHPILTTPTPRSAGTAVVRQGCALPQRCIFSPGLGRYLGRRSGMREKREFRLRLLEMAGWAAQTSSCHRHHKSRTAARTALYFARPDVSLATQPRNKLQTTRVIVSVSWSIRCQPAPPAQAPGKAITFRWQTETTCACKRLSAPRQIRIR